MAAVKIVPCSMIEIIISSCHQTNEPTERQTDSQRDRQTKRRTDRQIHTYFAFPRFRPCSSTHALHSSWLAMKPHPSGLRLARMCAAEAKRLRPVSSVGSRCVQAAVLQSHDAHTARDPAHAARSLAHRTARTFTSPWQASIGLSTTPCIDERVFSHVLRVHSVACSSCR